MTTDLDDRNRRADAQRNRAAILDGTVTCLSVNPRASMAEIAQAAGIGRVTLYGHFSSRKELLEAVVERTMHEAEAQLAPLDLGGDPRTALDLLIRSSWRIIDKLHGLMAAAEQELGADRIRDHHDETLHRVRGLIERGQAEGAFRSDQSSSWITACFFAILHGASGEIRAGRLSDRDAAAAIPSTIQAIVAVPADADAAVGTA